MTKRHPRRRYNLEVDQSFLATTSVRLKTSLQLISQKARLIISLSHGGLEYPYEKQARLIRTFQIDVQRFSKQVHVEQRSVI